jgi:hypothetical protein
MTYKIAVDDNFHYMDENERSTLGEFETAASALSEAKALVDADLNSLYRPGMTAAELYDLFTSFGSDPFIVSEDQSCHFSAWSYAKQRCQEICKHAAQAHNNEMRLTPP